MVNKLPVAEDWRSRDGKHRWIADAIDDGLRLLAIVETVKTGWVFRQRAKFIGTRIIVLHDGR